MLILYKSFYYINIAIALISKYVLYITKQLHINSRSRPFKKFCTLVFNLKQPSPEIKIFLNLFIYFFLFKRSKVYRVDLTKHLHRYLDFQSTNSLYS